MKKVKRFYLLSALALALLASCGQNQEQKEELPVVEEPAPVVIEETEENKETVERVYAEVMKIHDRSMAKMSEIRSLSGQLTDSIEHTNANPMEQEEVINRYRNHLKDLKEANQEMLQWMRQFDGAGKSLSEQEKLEYLKEEKEKISNVDQQVNEAIKNAREVLN